MKMSGDEEFKMPNMSKDEHEDDQNNDPSGSGQETKASPVCDLWQQWGPSAEDLSAAGPSTAPQDQAFLESSEGEEEDGVSAGKSISDSEDVSESDSESKVESGDEEEDECLICLDRITGDTELLICLPCQCCTACVLCGVEWVFLHKMCYMCNTPITVLDIVEARYKRLYINRYADGPKDQVESRQ